MNIEIKAIKELGNVQGVCVRELYDFLELDKTHYKRWVKTNLDENKFFELNYDYIRLSHKGVAGNNTNATITNHYVTLDVAKELCMLSRSEKAKEVRQYFILCENELKRSINANLALKGDDNLIAINSELLTQIDAQIMTTQKKLDLLNKSRIKIVEAGVSLQDLNKINYDYTVTRTSVRDTKG